MIGRPAKSVNEGRLKGVVYFPPLATDEKKALLDSGEEPYEFNAEWRATREKITEVVDGQQAAFLERGFFVFDMGRAGLRADGRVLGLFPTDDKYVVIATMGTGCNDGENGPAEVIAWFMEAFLNGDSPNCTLALWQLEFIEAPSDRATMRLRPPAQVAETGARGWWRRLIGRRD